MAREPQTLMDAIRFFADPDVALEFMVSLRWPNGVACPREGGKGEVAVPRGSEGGTSTPITIKSSLTIEGPACQRPSRCATLAPEARGRP